MSLDEIESENELIDIILKSKTPVLVDVFAPWCGPCKMLTPILKECAELYSEQIRIVKVNADVQSDFALRYGIRSIPTMLFFDSGEVVQTKIGICNRKELIELIEGIIK